MIEKLRHSLDSGGASTALLNDHSKALDCLPKLLTAKFHAKKVDLPSDPPPVLVQSKQKFLQFMVCKES